jgi:hypothetical protein
MQIYLNSPSIELFLPRKEECGLSENKVAAFEQTEMKSR